MKFSLFSVVALASAAMAAPAVQVQAKAGKVEAAVQARQVAAVPIVGGVTETVTSGTITKSVTKKITGTKVTNTGGVVKVLTIAVDQTKVQTSSIKQTISQVKAGTLSKAAAITHVHQSVSIINDLLTTVVGQLKDLVKIDINLPDVQVILGLVIKLVHEVVAIVKDIVRTLGIDNILASVLQLLFRLVATLLGLVTELIGDIVPGVVDILNNVLNTLSGTDLGPIIAPVSDILDSLTGTLAQGTTGISA